MSIRVAMKKKIVKKPIKEVIKEKVYAFLLPVDNAGKIRILNPLGLLLIFVILALSPFLIFACEEKATVFYKNLYDDSCLY